MFLFLVFLLLLIVSTVERSGGTAGTQLAKAAELNPSETFRLIDEALAHNRQNMNAIADSMLNDVCSSASLVKRDGQKQTSKLMTLTVKMCQMGGSAKVRRAFGADDGTLKGEMRAALDESFSAEQMPEELKAERKIPQKSHQPNGMSEKFKKAVAAAIGTAQAHGLYKGKLGAWLDEIAGLNLNLASPSTIFLLFRQLWHAIGSEAEEGQQQQHVRRHKRSNPFSPEMLAAVMFLALSLISFIFHQFNLTHLLSDTGVCLLLYSYFCMLQELQRRRDGVPPEE